MEIFKYAQIIMIRTNHNLSAYKVKELSDIDMWLQNIG